jgi:hypothetical protein
MFLFSSARLWSSVFSLLSVHNLELELRLVFEDFQMSTIKLLAMSGYLRINGRWTVTSMVGTMSHALRACPICSEINA